MQPDGTGITVQLDLEFLAGFQAQATGIGVADQQIAVAVHPGAELGLAAPCTPGMTGALRQRPTLFFRFGFHQRAAETFLQNTPAGTDIATSQGDLFF